MNWKEKEAEVLARLEANLEPENWKWVQRSVNFDAGDLETASSTEVRQWFHRPDGHNLVNDTLLIRTLIWQTWVKIQSGGTPPVGGNLRSLWYQVIGPFYNEHQLSKAPTRASKPDKPESKIYHLALELVGDFVRNRVFLYRPEFDFQCPFEARYVIGRDRPRYILYTEKEGLWKTICEEAINGGLEGLEMRITGLATKGEPSFVAVEWLAQELKELKDPVANPVVLAFVDRDPWGLQIAEQIDAKLRFFNFKSVTTYMLVSLDMFSAHNLKGATDLSQVKGSRKLIDHWMKITGGVNGKELGLHCDVISQGRREEMFSRIYKGIHTNDLERYFERVKPVGLDQTGEDEEPPGLRYI